MNNNQCIIDALLIISRLIRSLEVNKRQWQERDRQTHAHIEGGGGGGRRRREEEEGKEVIPSTAAVMNSWRPF